ncbi:MAG: hypothetical protein WCF51_01775 [Nitrosomonadaceae bacterium]
MRWHRLILGQVMRQFLPYPAEVAMLSSLFNGKRRRRDSEGAIKVDAG